MATAEATDLIEVSREEFDRKTAIEEHYEAIVAKTHDVNQLKKVWEEAKDASLAAKKSFDRASNELRELIEEGVDPQRRLPGMSATDGQRDDEWRNRPIAELGLPNGKLDKLEECGVTTIGQLEKLRAGELEDNPRGLSSVKGFGEAAITDIENSLMEWLAKNQPTDDAPMGGTEDTEPPQRVRIIDDITDSEGDIVMHTGDVVKCLDIQGDQAIVEAADGDQYRLDLDEYELIDD